MPQNLDLVTAEFVCLILLSHGQRGGCPLSWNADANTIFLYVPSSDAAAHYTAVDGTVLL